MDDEAIRRAFLLSLAVGCYRDREFDEALRLLDALAGDVPHGSGAWQLRGKCLLSLRRYTEAAECFERAGALGGPCGEDAVVWQAGALDLAGRAEEAKQLLRAYLLAEGGSPEVVAQARAELARLEGRAEPGAAPDPAGM